MKKSAQLRSLIALLMVFCLVSPIWATAAISGKGEKNYKQGLVYETAKQWDKAVEEFTLALAAKPGNVEYQLHYRRALFNASQMMMERGRTLAEQKDYIGAYNAFRQAYAYDPVNELAKAEMDRMVRLQKGENVTGNEPKDEKSGVPTVKLTPTSYKPQTQKNNPSDDPQADLVRSYKFSTPQDLQTEIRRLARDIGLNVIFDAESFRQPRTFKADFEDVTTAQLLDWIFLQEGLFFQRVGKRTILVATGIRRQFFQQLVLRTFYLSNAAPDDVKNIIGQAIPPQPGRQTQVLSDKATNSITVRDTSENIKLIAQLIKAVDKDRAEVVIDVGIYEVSKTDLLKLGNQVGTETSLSSLGGSSGGYVGLGGNRRSITNTILGAAASSVLPPVALGAGLLIPQSSLQAFQSRGNAKVLASTQIHAFNNEESSARIGQRVPVQTASVYNGAQNTGNGGVGGAGNVFGGGYPVINYEQVGLTLKFKPIVFPNQDVQMEMDIESKDVVASGSTPTFSERTIKGTARVQNNRTLLLASVAQDTESNGSQGIPLLGAIPVLGRLFSSPTKDNRQVDIVIAVTPRVLRAPTVLPEDEEERVTGTVINPTNGQVADLIREVEQEEQFAAERRTPNTAVVQLPDQPTETPAYSPAKNSDVVITAKDKDVGTVVSEVEKGWETVTPATAKNNVKTTLVANKPTAENPVNATSKDDAPAVVPKPIDSTKAIKTLNITPTADSSDAPTLKPVSFVESAVVKALPTKLGLLEMPASVAPNAEILLLTPLMKKGEVKRVPVMIKTSAPFKLGVLSLNFDSSKVLVRQVINGETFGKDLANSTATPFLNSNGMLTVSFASAGKPDANSGILAYLEIEALADGKPEFKFDADTMRFASTNGETFTLKFVQ